MGLAATWAVFWGFIQAFWRAAFRPLTAFHRPRAWAPPDGPPTTPTHRAGTWAAPAPITKPHRAE